MFLLEIIHTETSNMYVFPSEIQTIEDSIIQYSIGSYDKRKPACVYITVDDTEEATLDMVSYSSKCDIDNLLINKSGTIQMIMGSLKYIFQKHPHIRFISLNDKSMIPSGKIHVSAKRLIQGRPSWYEEHLGAKPDKRHPQTIKTLNLLKQPTMVERIQAYQTIMLEQHWGTSKDIIDMYEKITGLKSNVLLGTAWTISRKTIKKYPIRVSEKESKPFNISGGKAILHKKWIQHLDLLMMQQ
jgi:hypothetical protein